MGASYVHRDADQHVAAAPGVEADGVTLPTVHALEAHRGLRLQAGDGLALD